MKQRNPWAWVPTLYFAEGLPNVLVTGVAAVMYMQMGLTDTELALYTGWLNLPWIIKPLWSPFIDLLSTKRWWILNMQILIGAALAGVAFTLNTPVWFQMSMCFFFIMAFASATHDISADGFYMIELDEHTQTYFVGIRNTFYRIAVIFGNGVVVAIPGILIVYFRNSIAFVWSLVFYGLAGIFIALWLFHHYILPKSAGDKRGSNSASEVWKGLKSTLLAFFKKFPVRTTIIAICFMLFYRFPEALLNTMTKTFLMRPNSEGGLGMAPTEYGLSYGTVGLIGLTLGGIIGGILVSRDGMKRWLWPLVCAITLPDIVYVYLAFAMPEVSSVMGLSLVSACLFVEQFGYGLGFTVLTLYMLYYSQGEFKTSHYAICTGISYLGLMLPGMVSGWIKDAVGYQTFFIIVMATCALTFIVTWFLEFNPEFGKKKISEDQSNHV
jgi:PAT family beta-lactamase induction signal transducer AmpG